MRAFIASSIGVTCAAALVLPLAAPAGAAPDTPAPHSAAMGPAPAEASEPAPLSGSTQSLALTSLPAASARATGQPIAAAAGQGLTERDVRAFSMVGVVWDDVNAELHGTAQVRTRATGTHRWSGWQDLETHNAEHSADPGTAERDSGAVRGSTAPLWVGDSDGVEVRVNPEAPDARGGSAPSVPLPGGLRLELVDPGKDPRQLPATGAVGADRTAGVTALPALSRLATDAAAGYVPGAAPFIGPRPRIITRQGWGADEKLRERAFTYTKSVKAAFIHHSATGNNYACSQAPAVLRGIYRYHVKSSGWRDIGYNFAVDKCGNIYEGRAGGVTKAVMGAHTLGFNTNTMGIAVLGTFSNANPPAAAVDAVAKLTAWKLGLYGANPKGKVTLVSGGSNKYKKGKKVKLNVISGHRDGFATECPGARLYKKLGTTRTSSARLQGR
ncbi:N-acetylmuramoyl-L-alanine amidase [Streptomyces brevispora]|uniref:peptidoglycan recognition protein family protein n=1 Tax=Streptomyces brevispora TaxID=887462 RepID=UPI002E2EE703|nr:N-acetylmuramoyl-L-alanine amidase [Streptomyces brevispora]